MKKLLSLIVLLLLAGFSPYPPKLTEAEREAAAAELTKTRDRLLSITDGLSDEQLGYKISPDSWSVAECIEHIAVSESNLDQMLQGALKEKADPARRVEVQLSDEQVLAMIADRSNKVKTPEAFEPSGKFGSVEATLEAFETARQAHIDYVITTGDDLRNHYAKTPVGTVDAYQVLMFISAHTERHIRQIEEVMANADFPME